jgi:hypothetical protein
VSGLSILLVANEHLLWLSTSESSSSGAIDTSNSSVRVWVDSLVPVSLESSWDSLDLLNNLSSVQRLGCHIVYII